VTKAELTEAIKSRALALGFDKVGIVPAGVLAEEGARLREWLGRGFAGTMSWMERTAEKRADPSLHLEGVRSVVCVASNYYTPHRHSDEVGTGKISRYAWGDDYHDVLGARLRGLAAAIRDLEPDIRAKIAVDSSPVMDKAWAARAGIGWIGKHSNVITREFGSWVFLGEILVDLELEYEDLPVHDQCGSCTACIEACPTGAIVEPYLVDSNLCVSYVTIENRDETLALDTHGWVYGCDVCQDVCPWNRFQRETSDPRFEPRTGLVEPNLADLATMSRDEFSSRFRKSAIKRTKLEGLVRNAAAVSGRQRERE
jgi:epoxyqueuosine reductase